MTNGQDKEMSELKIGSVYIKLGSQSLLLLPFFIQSLKSWVSSISTLDWVKSDMLMERL